MIPVGLFIMISVFPFLFGRCLTISATVNFTRKLPTALLVNFIMLAVNSLVAIVMDSVYFGAAKNPGLAIFMLLLVHCVILACFVPLMIVTLRCSAEVAKQTLIFHDYLIEYRATPKGKLKLNNKHIAPMEVIAEEDSIYERSAASILVPGDLEQSRIFVFSQDGDDNGYNSSDDEYVPRFNHSISDPNHPFK